MLQSLKIAALVAFATLLPHGRADEQKARGAEREQGIKAEVRGTLHIDTGRGYFISVKFRDQAKRESRVWLQVSENKILVEQLAGLTGKEVLAKGNLEQMPENVVGASVPPLGIYLRLNFEIEHAGAK